MATGIATKQGFRAAEIAAITKLVAAGEEYATAVRAVSPRADAATAENWRDDIEARAAEMKRAAAAVPKPAVPAEQHEGLRQKYEQLRLEQGALRDVNESLLRERDALAAKVTELEELVLGDGKKKK